MAENPQPARYRPRTDILSLGAPFYDAVAAAQFPAHTLRFRNDRAAGQIGIVPASRTPAQAGVQSLAEPSAAIETLDPRLRGNTLPLSDAQWIDHFGRFVPLPGSLSEPLALRYHGHQFQSYNPDIGDGRGFLFAQATDTHDRLLDLGTKGSGQTPYSRFGDGRLTLKGGVREVLATEMLEALNVPTSRSFSLIETGEELVRGDEPSPTRSAVLVRLNHSHVRIGTFQRLAYERDAEAMHRLVDYVLTRLYHRTPGSEPAIELFDEAVGRIATLAARFMAAGFVHGVLNTDNINLTGESFDYGPWRFAPTWDAGFTAAYFDHHGLYAYGRQPDAMHWNAMQLAVALRTVVDPAADRRPRNLPGALCPGGGRSHPLAPRRPPPRRRRRPRARRCGDDRAGDLRHADRRLLSSRIRRLAARRRGMGRVRGSPRPPVRLSPAHRPQPPLLVRREPLFDADRRGGGDLGADRRGR